jgi:hypothetical protein
MSRLMARPLVPRPKLTVNRFPRKYELGTAKQATIVGTRGSSIATRNILVVSKRAKNRMPGI